MQNNKDNSQTSLDSIKASIDKMKQTANQIDEILGKPVQYPEATKGKPVQQLLEAVASIKLEAPKKEAFEVIVDNIGTVYLGEDRKEAFKSFNDYKALSIANQGRAGNEAVTLLEGLTIQGELEVVEEFQPDEISEAIERVIDSLTESQTEYFEESEDFVSGYDCLLSEAYHPDIFNRCKDEISEVCKLPLEALEVLEDWIDLRESAYEWKCFPMFSSGSILELEAFNIGEQEVEVPYSTIQDLLKSNEELEVPIEAVEAIVRHTSGAYSCQSGSFFIYCNSDCHWTAILPVEACKELITASIIAYLSK
jgi:hypothetical protein